MLRLDGVADAYGEAFQRRLLSVMDDVPGIENIRIRAERGKTPKMTFTGWSPSLHRCTVELHAGIAAFGVAGATDEDRERAILEDVADVLATQRRAADDAAALGEDRPLQTDILSLLRIDHLRIDESEAVAASVMGYDLSATVRTAMRPLHDGTGYAGSEHLASDAGAVGREDGMRYVTARIDIVRGGATLASIRDCSLLLPFAIPDTASANLVDGPIGRIASLHERLDRRIVTRVETWSGPGRPRTLVDFEPRYVSMSEAIETSRTTA